MDLRDVLYEKHDGVARLTINRPARLNACTALTVHELRATLRDMLSRADTPTMTVSLVSFGYKYGVPTEADLVLPEADAVFLAVPSTEKSNGMMGAKQFELMKQGSYFIAMSRGKIYDHQALVRALDSKRLAGAGLDATNPEPLPKGHALWKFPNVVITPHTSGGSDNLQGRLDYIVKENIRRFGAGLPLLNVVDKKEGF